MLRRVIARAWAAGLGVLVGAAPAHAEPDLEMLARLPASSEFVVAAGNLRDVLPTPGWRGTARFLDELGAWSRTAEAWGEIARALGLTPDAALDEIVGSQVVFAMRGLDASGGPEHALLCEVSADTERRLRERLRPAPRALQQRLPILALENGAFDVSTWIPPASGGRARLLVTPRGSERFFDDLLPALRDASPSAALRGTPSLAALGTLPPGALGVLSRRPGGAASEERYLAASIRVDGPAVTAEMLATRDMVLPVRVPGAVLEARAPDAWPSHAADFLAQDATLLVVGSPREQPLDLDADLGGGRVRTTMLLSLLGMLQLPPSLERRIDGVALVGVHEIDPSADAGFAISIAIPARDIEAYAPMADRWGVSLAGDEGLELPPAPLDSVRVLSVAGERSPVLSGLARPGGSIAWTYARAPGTPEGWWVLHIRMARGDEARAAEAARALAERLERPLDARDPGLFRLLIRPARLTTLLRRDRAPGPDAPSDALRVFRWIDRFESTLWRAEAGLVRGRITLRVSEDALAAP
jgi:hypothetical protein